MLKLGLAISVLVALLALLGGCVAPQQSPSSQGGFDWTIIIFLVAIFAVFYFLMVRPQRKKQKQQQELIHSLKRGDNVVTAGGIYGEIDIVADDSIVLKVESGATIRVAKSSVLGVRQK
ncbi:MAG: preprotein translocase subunit YajC [Dehalococcoidales bacterium]|nr:preprotein translocase subunit YajC [Dehalococcoidales bacterium]